MTKMKLFFWKDFIHKLAVFFILMELRKISKSFDHSTIIPSLHLLVLHIKALPQFFSKNLIITIKGTNIGKLVTKGNDLSVSWCMVL